MASGSPADSSPPPPRYADLLARLDAARAAGVLLGLDRIREVLRRLGDPQTRFRAVQIAGTNGKGSTAAMTDAILRAAGWRVGLYTSPHLSRFTERIRVDGAEVDGDRLAVLERSIAATEIPLTYFEIATALAFLTFAERNVDIAVVETGLGGRLDATTACVPVGTAITSIAWDHMEMLGSTLAAIAAEKAGIAKANVPLFLGPVPPEADAVIAAIAERVGAPLRRIDRITDVDVSRPSALGVTGGGALQVALAGAHQTTNAALAVALAEIASEAAGRRLDTSAIAAGLSAVRWPGRLEWLADDVLVDCAHNAEGATALAAELDHLPRTPRALLFSAVSGKPAGEMLRLLARCFDTIIVTRSSNPRSMDVEALRTLAVAAARPACAVLAIPNPIEALRVARAAVAAAAATSASGAPKELPAARPAVVGAGSTFLVGDLRAYLLSEKRDPLPTSDPISIVAT